jgi:hypothetical protein
MELIGTIQKIISNALDNAGLTDIVIGTVTQINPLEITLMSTMLPLPQEVLILTESVIEKKLTITDHIHDVNHNHAVYDTYTGGGSSGFSNICSEELTEIYCYENGKQLPRQDPGGNAYIIINRALAVGDKVIMLRVLNGQNFIVLSRVF